MILYVVPSLYVMLAVAMTVGWMSGWTELVIRHRISDFRYYRPYAVSAVWTWCVLLSGNWGSARMLVVTVVIAAVCAWFAYLAPFAEVAWTRTVAHIRRG